MYEEFFGLNRPPFKITPDTSLFYDGGQRGDVLGALVYAVQRGEGIVKVVGEVGSGKTMLCRMLQQELPKTVEIIYIANPSVSADDILFVIAHELNLDVQKDSSKHEVMHLLQTHLLNRFTSNRQVVLFVEEAQGMPLETLEEIRLLSNLETDQDKLLQIILFGQPELDDNLKTASIRQLKERITHEFNLAPLTAQEIHQYLNFRMREVGYTGPELIDTRVAKAVSKYSGGLLRRINIIADKILLSAFAQSTHDITVKHVNAAVKDSGFERSIDGKLTTNNKGLYVILGLLIFVLALLFVSGKGSILLGFFESNQQSQKMVVTKPVTPKVLSDVVIDRVDVDLIKKDEQFSDEAEKIFIEEEVALYGTASIKEERLTSIVNRKKRDLNLSEQISSKESNESTKIVKKSLSIPEETTKIAEKEANNERKKHIKDIVPFANAYWLDWKLKKSKVWLSKQPREGVSIQVMMRSQSAAEELVNVLRHQWPLDVENTHLYAVTMNGNNIYRVFYGGYISLSEGQRVLNELPEKLRLNGPYLHSLYKMKKTLL